jgi:hypothetical protein
MKLLNSLILFCLLSTYLSAQENRASYGLNGRVKMIEISSYDFVEKFGEIEIGSFNGREVVQFNEVGNIIKKFNINGDRTSKDTSSISTYEYILNENKNLKEINEYYQYSRTSSKSLKYKTRFKYDTEGKMIEKKVYNGSDGSFDSGFIYSYENGEKKEQKINEDGAVMDHFFEIADVYVDETDQEVTYKEEYDANKNWIKKIEFRRNKEVKGLDRKIIYYTF